MVATVVVAIIAALIVVATLVVVAAILTIVALGALIGVSVAETGRFFILVSRHKFFHFSVLG